MDAKYHACSVCLGEGPICYFVAQEGAYYKSSFCILV